jgi:hypothetical protein
MLYPVQVFTAVDLANVTIASLEHGGVFVDGMMETLREVLIEGIP